MPVRHPSYPGSPAGGVVLVDHVAPPTLTMWFSAPIALARRQLCPIGTVMSFLTAIISRRTSPRRCKSTAMRAADRAWYAAGISIGDPPSFAYIVVSLRGGAER